MVVIFLWNVPKTAVWQAALDFELTNILTGYGNGKIKKEAENDAWQVLYKRLALEKGNDSFRVEEEQEAYTVDVAT